jgi:hypothetical protein
MIIECELTPAQHARLVALPEHFRVVGWDYAFGSGKPGPLLEDPRRQSLCRLTPHGRLTNHPSEQALADLAWRRSE